MLSFYNKIHEVVGLLAELLNVQVLTDTTVLHLSTLGVAPFFVEHVSELQLSALKLVTGVIFLIIFQKFARAKYNYRLEYICKDSWPVNTNVYNLNLFEFV